LPSPALLTRSDMAHYSYGLALILALSLVACSEGFRLKHKKSSTFNQTVVLRTKARCDIPFAYDEKESHRAELILLGDGTAQYSDFIMYEYDDGYDGWGGEYTNTFRGDWSKERGAYIVHFTSAEAPSYRDAGHHIGLSCSFQAKLRVMAVGSVVQVSGLPNNHKEFLQIGSRMNVYKCPVYFCYGIAGWENDVDTDKTELILQPTPAPTPAPTPSPSTCPKKFPKCYSDGTCVTSSCRNGGCKWRKGSNWMSLSEKCTTNYDP